MADEMEEVVEQPSVDKKAEKKAEKERKKAEKARKKAEKQSNEFETEEESIGGKILIFFVTLIIILIWLAIIALLIKWDVGGFGSGVLAPILKDVPYVNQILPDSAIDELSTEDSAYAFDSMDEAVDYIKQLELQLAEAQNNSSQDASYIEELEAQAAELAVYKQEEAEFEAEKEKFYEEVVFSDSAPDIDEYKAYYESIDPTNAEMIYRQVVEQTAEDEELEDYVKAYSSMKPKEAAAIFDTMTDNLKLVAEILENMDAQSRADILGKMDSDTAAKVTEIMKPSE
jgi:flagellar motility protein MotE (MotC chaperone)